MCKAEKKENEFWHNLEHMAQLETNGRAVAKIANQQIALFETEGRLFAVNNRCPHEGYPLAEGSLQDGCRLACNWHGWTFDLSSGKALQGRDRVRTYPVERRQGEIWVQISPPDFKVLKHKALQELSEAAEEHDYARISQSLSRLEKAGGSLEEAAVQTINWSANRLERGFGHAHAGLADWISLAGQNDEQRRIAFLEAIGHFSWDSVFSPEAAMPVETLPWQSRAFLAAIEGMDQKMALRLCNGALEEGLGFRDLKPLLLDQIFAYYAGFGHPAIYVMKAETLINQLGPAVEASLCRQITRYLCLAAREDLVPEFRLFTDLLDAKAIEPSGEAITAQTLSGMPTRQILPAVVEARGANTVIWETLVGAAALNMLKFDLTLQDRIQQPIAQNVGWLDFTHALTFAEALFQHASLKDEYWRSGHLQLACFIGRNAGFLAEIPYDEWLVADSKAFWARQKSDLLNMDTGEYIYGVHRLKLILATENMLQHVGEHTQDLLLAALNRFLSSKARQRHPARTAFQAHASVEREG